MIRLNWTERVAYVLGMMLCIISDAVVDAWRWLQCPAPDQPRPAEDNSSFSNGMVAVLAIVTIILTIINLTGLWIFQA